MAVKRVVGFSGGADSQACALWVRNHFPPEDIILLNCDPGGNEHPLTTEFIEWYSTNVFPVTILKPKIKDLEYGNIKANTAKKRVEEFDPEDELTFERLIYLHGLSPANGRAFCTTHLKLVPAKRWCDEHLLNKGIEYERYSGVRADESRKRSQRKVREWDDFFDVYLNHPIIDWSKEQVFDYLAEHGEEFNPLYKLGFSRLGCAPCVNPNKEDIKNWADRFPEMIDKVRSWEQSTGKTFFSPCVPRLRINWIDDVVQWSRTVRGGKQQGLPFAPDSCASKYGLCE